MTLDTEHSLRTEIQKNKVKTLWTVIGGIILIMTSIVMTNLFAWPAMVRANSADIVKLKLLKVDQLKFNEFINMQQDYITLLRERQDILCKRMDSVEEKISKIEIERLKEIEIEIKVLQTNLKNLMKQYGYYTRGNEKILVSLDWFIVEPLNT